MKYVITHYSGDWRWVLNETDDYLIFNRSGEDIPGSIKTENIGDADYDKLKYIVDNYNDLPEVFLWSKSNLFKFITKEEFDKLKDNREFTPLLTQNHKVYEPVCRYNNGIYEEINNSWYLNSVPSKYFTDYGHFAFTFELPNPEYLQFSPGGSYILTKDRVQRQPKSFYEDWMSLLPYSQRPGEAQFMERTYYTLWS